MKSTKNKLLASIATLCVCFAMLIGSTYAWFTDSASTGVNKIQAGNLDIEAYYQKSILNPSDNDVTIDMPDNFTRSDKVLFEAFNETQKLDGSVQIINEPTWEPGKVGARLITVKNKGNLDAKIKLDFITTDEGLESALWFDFVMVNTNNTTAGRFEFRPMSTLQQTADQTGSLSLPKESELRFILVYGMYESAGNQYQNKSFSAKVFISATQLNSESDSFDNQYDKDAEYPVIVSSQDAFSNAVATSDNSNIVLSAGTYTLPAAANKTVAISGTKDTVIDLTSSTGQNLSGTDLTFENVTVKGINADYVGIQHSGDIVYNNVTFNDSTTLYGESVTFNNCTFNLSTRYIWTYGAKEVTFNNCTFNTDGKAILIYAEGGVDSQTVNVNGCTFNATGSGYTSSKDRCAAVEIDARLISGTYTVNFTGSNTVDTDFNGIYRIKNNSESKVTINGIS